MSNNCGCGDSIPVKTLKPGDLDEENTQNGWSKSTEDRTNNNGGKCSPLSRFFCASNNSEGTKKKQTSDSPAVSSEDGAHCDPD